MIVKDESHVIERSLASAKPLIDYWVIVNTGSTDGTQDVIREFLKDIPGELHERPWKNFGYNRTEALELAREKPTTSSSSTPTTCSNTAPPSNSLLSPPTTTRCLGASKNSNVCNQKPTLVKTSLDWSWVIVYH